MQKEVGSEGRKEGLKEEEGVKGRRGGGLE